MNSDSQLKQDLWVLKQTSNKKDGYFVEAGASDGIILSNTYMLEKEYNWQGICCEPNPEYHRQLAFNRKCNIEFNCLYSISNQKLEFTQSHELGGITKEFKNDGDDPHTRRMIRAKSPKSIVNTISLNDMLEKHNAPHNIDYISLDTEGSELKILSTFDFNKYDVKLWTIEHNNIILNELLSIFIPQGYEYLKQSFDCWLFKNSK